MLKKIVALLMALILVFAMTACAKTEAPATKDPEPTKAAEETQGAEESAEPSEEPTGEVVTLKYYEIGNNDVNTREAVQDAINAHVEPLINANVEFQIIGWGDWDNKALTALQSGEEIDIFFTADWKSYVRSVTQNLFTPLNDDNGEHGNLLEKYGQGILDSINPAFITGTQFGGVNYAVPTNKELCVPMGWIYNVDGAEEVGMDPTTIKTTEDFEAYLAKWKELHPDQYPFLTDGGWGDEPWVPGCVSNLNGGLVSMHQEKDANGNFDETWVEVWGSPENQAHCETMYKWMQAGYIHPDAPLSTFASVDIFNTGNFLVYPQPLKGDNIKGQELVNASGNKNLNVDEIYGQGKYIVTTHSGGSMLAIPVSSENPVTAMKYINLMHTDSDLLDIMLFGVPETMWKFADDGRVDLIDASWNGAHGGAWTLGNTAIQHVTTNEDPDKNQKLQDYSADATPHPTLGFRYVCPPELESQWAALNNVQESMNRSLLTGGTNPDQIPQYLADQKAAGLDDVLADVERQYNEWQAKK